MERGKQMQHRQNERFAAAKERWGSTDAFREFETREAGQSLQQTQAAGDGLMRLLAVFGTLQNRPVSDPAVQQQVKALQNYITAHFYTCTDEILAGLGTLYVRDEAFSENIDRSGGAGTAAFAARAIAHYCKTK